MSSWAMLSSCCVGYWGEVSEGVALFAGGSTARHPDLGLKGRGGVPGGVRGWVEGGVRGWVGVRRPLGRVAGGAGTWIDSGIDSGVGSRVGGGICRRVRRWGCGRMSGRVDCRIGCRVHRGCRCRVRGRVGSGVEIGLIVGPGVGLAEGQACRSSRHHLAPAEVASPHQQCGSVRGTKSLLPTRGLTCISRSARAETTL